MKAGTAVLLLLLPNDYHVPCKEKTRLSVRVALIYLRCTSPYDGLVCSLIHLCCTSSLDGDVKVQSCRVLNVNTRPQQTPKKVRVTTDTEEL